MPIRKILKTITKNPRNTKKKNKLKPVNISENNIT